MPQGNSPRRQRLHMHLCWRSTGPCPETCLCLPEGAEPLVAAIHQASSLSRQPSGTVIATLNGYATSVSQDETELGAFRTMNCDILAAPRVCRAKQQCTFGTLESTQLPNYRKHFPVCHRNRGESWDVDRNSRTYVLHQSTLRINNRPYGRFAAVSGATKRDRTMTWW